MIRGLFLLLVLLAGLAAAALFQGRMHHIRLALSDRLPGWSDSIAADAGVRQGKMRLPSQGRWPKTEVTWTVRAPTRTGWVWDVALTGEGVSLKGQAVLAFKADRVIVSGVTGSVDLGNLADLPLPVQGVLQVTSLTGVAVDLWAQPILTGALQGQIPALRIEDQDFGSGPLTGTLDDNGQWRADLALTGGVSPISADLAGQLNASVAQLDINFADGPALPATLRAMLSAVGRAEGQGWLLSLAVPVP